MENDSFVIFLDGGGLCLTEQACKHRANTSKGSATKWLNFSTDNSNVLSSNPFNPFGNWTHVRVPYGSGDVYIGRQRVANSIGLYFAGHNTLEAIVSDLKNRSGFGSARRVLFSGGSAGGIGVLQNADWLGTQLGHDTVYKASPQAGGYFSNSFLKIMPQYASGLFNGSSSGGAARDPGVNAASLMADVVVSWFGGATGQGAIHMDQSCVEALPLLKKHTCWSAAVHYPFITTPLFLAQNRFDLNQIQSVMGTTWWPYPKGEKEHALAVAAYVRYFGQRTVSGIAHAVIHGPKNATDGLFMPSCFAHCSNLCMLDNSSMVQGFRYHEALEDWFEGRGKVPHLLFDDCNAKEGTEDPCNRNCGCYR